MPAVKQDDARRSKAPAPAQPAPAARVEPSAGQHAGRSALLPLPGSAHPHLMRAHELLRLHHVIGNHGVHQLLAAPGMAAGSRTRVQKQAVAPQAPAASAQQFPDMLSGLGQAASPQTQPVGPAARGAVAAQPGSQAAAPPAAVRDEDLAEFNHLRVRTSRGDSTAFAGVEDYVTYRDAHFGGRTEYDAVRAIADAEWEANATIRSRVGQGDDSAGRRQALYRWVRLEYRRAGFDSAEAIEALMRQGMTSDLQAIVARVRGLHPGLRTGGFIARPRKGPRGYRLGTLSEHGTGRAFDIRPQTANPQIPPAAWRFIEALTGQTVDRGLARWREEPAALWQDIHDLNESYGTTVTEQIQAHRQAREAAGHPLSDAAARDAVLANSTWLRNRARQHGLGFFTLSRELVLALHAEGLTWGATFPTPDLHHFELP